MTRSLIPFSLALVLANACSTSDQSLGESLPKSDEVPLPDLGPPPPAPNPAVSPCADSSLHRRVGRCVPSAIACDVRELTGAGYECAAELHCCEVRPVGCPPGGCGDAGAGGAG